MDDNLAEVGYIFEDILSGWYDDKERVPDIATILKTELTKRGFNKKVFNGQTYFFNILLEETDKGTETVFYFLNSDPEHGELWKVPYADSWKFNKYMTSRASGLDASVRSIAEFVGGSACVLYLGNGQESVAAEIMKGGFFILGGIASGLGANQLIDNYPSKNFKPIAVDFQESMYKLAELDFPVLNNQKPLVTHTYQ
jgi:hypothetical protein